MGAVTLVLKESIPSKVLIQLQRHARRLPLFSRALHQRHEAGRARHRARLPRLTGELGGLLGALRDEGVVQTRLDQLGVPVDATLAAVDAHVETLRRRPMNGEHCHLVTHEELLASSEPYLFGMAEPLLDFAENYFGLPVNYLGVNVKREVANGKLTGTRNWHEDPEDENVLKIIVYLNDVGPGGGAFECLDAPTSARAVRETGYLWGGSCDIDKLRRAVPEKDWRTWLGPRLAAHVVDTARCMHRASPPTVSDRYSMTFSYLSSKAYFVFEEGKILQDAFVARWPKCLTPRQLASLTLLS
jgi:hypothetical protein